MAKQRFLNTKFWTDGFVERLKPLERYLFLYFLTNEHTNICGIYELTLKTIAFETDLPTEQIKKIINRLAGKVYYINGWVYVKNFERHQYARGNSKVIIGIANAKKDIPPHILQKVQQIQDEVIPLKGVSTLDSDSDSDLDLDSDADRTAKLLKTWKQNPLWERLVKKYPFRDYELEFEKMLAWWATKKKKPKSISAFANWLAKSYEDNSLRLEAARELQNDRMLKQADEVKNQKPISAETLKSLRDIKQNLRKKYEIPK